MTRRLVVVAVVVAAWCALGIGVRATFGVQVTADEPEYLMTALSLAEDRSLDVSDERLERRYEPFHELLLPIQTKLLDDGSRISPHDPLLPLLLAAPMKLGGWVAAKATLAVMAGLLAAVTLWTAVRRFGVSERTATITVLAFALAPPLSIYATQVYPELPAALVVVTAIACLSGPLRRWAALGSVAAVIALPWLAVKYVPVAAVIALWLLAQLWRRDDRRAFLVALGTLAVGGVTYLVAHRAWYGGWTVYATGDHFVGGEFTVVGNRPNPAGRSVRLIGLLVDRNFGLGVWQPLYFLLPVVGVVLARLRPKGWGLLVALFAAGWLNATFVALTMHGYWSPGRQLVVVLPAVVLAVAWWSARAGATRLVVAGGVVGALNFAWLVAERRTWVIDFFETTNPLVRLPMLVLPDYQRAAGLDWALHVAWVAVVVVVAHRTTRIRLA